MKLLTLSLLCTAVSGVARAEFRTWTSSDETPKKFEAEYISSGADSVALKLKDGKKIVLPLSKLVQADRDFVVKQPVRQPAAETPKETTEKPKETAAKPKDSEMAKALKGKLVKLEGKTLRKYDYPGAKAPEYYLIYWGASSSGPSRKDGPKLTELYDTKVAASSNVDFVHVNLDKEESKMKEFMKEVKFNFPAVSMEKAAKIKILNDLKPSSLPACKLLDASGKVIAEGDEAKQKAEELAATAAKSGTGN